MFGTLGLIRRAQGDPTDAVRWLRASYDGFKGLPGDHRAEIARTLSNLGNALDDVPDVDAAIEAHEEAVLLAGEILGPDHDTTITYVRNLAGTLAIAQKSDRLDAVIQGSRNIVASQNRAPRRQLRQGRALTSRASRTIALTDHAGACLRSLRRLLDHAARRVPGVARDRIRVGQAVVGGGDRAIGMPRLRLPARRPRTRRRDGSTSPVPKLSLRYLSARAGALLAHRRRLGTRRFPPVSC